MDELIAAAAEAMGVPPAMVERSAEARAKASGVPVEDVLRAWAGDEPMAAAPAESVGAEEPDQAPEPAPPPETQKPSEPAASGPMDEAAMIAAAAEKMGMPESMVRRSLAARSKASGQPEELILREWAGAQADVVPAPGAVKPIEPPVPSTGEAAPEPAAQAAPAEPAAPPADIGAMLRAAAEKMGMPESMVQRSADARAKAQDVPVEEVLADWAGVDAPAPAPAPAAAPSEEAAPASDGAAEPPAEATPVAPVEAETPEPAPEAPAQPESEGLDVEVLSDETDEGEPAVAQIDEDDFEPEEAAVAAGALPRWLAALFVFVPAFAIAYALFLPNGPNCGDAGRLAVDPVSGVAVNCDLSDFGEDFVDFFTLGSDTYAGIGCIACHGPGGAGVASFPAFTGGSLLSTFPEGQCSAQIEWIGLGTSGWPDPTYGATDKPVGGSGAVMPGFTGVLEPEEIASVALYERVAFGGQDLDAALADCGLGDAGAEVAAGE